MSVWVINKDGEERSPGGDTYRPIFRVSVGFLLDDIILEWLYVFIAQIPLLDTARLDSRLLREVDSEAVHVWRPIWDGEPGRRGRYRRG
jgi:hypothetical protein